MKSIDEELRSFIYDVTLFLQNSRSNSPETSDRMFQRAYKLYVKYDVENASQPTVEDGKALSCGYYTNIHCLLRLEGCNEGCPRYTPSA